METHCQGSRKTPSSHPSDVVTSLGWVQSLPVTLWECQPTPIRAGMRELCLRSMDCLGSWLESALCTEAGWGRVSSVTRGRARTLGKEHNCCLDGEEQRNLSCHGVGMARAHRRSPRWLLWAGVLNMGRTLWLWMVRKKPRAQVCLLGALTGHSLHLTLKSLLFISLPALIPTAPVYFCLLQAHRFPVDTAHSKPMCKLFTPKLTWRLTGLKPLPHIKAETHPGSPKRFLSLDPHNVIWTLSTDP